MNGESLVQTMSTMGMQLGSFFGIAVAVLAFVNGLILLIKAIKDRPILRIKAVHPEVYQWYFRIPSAKYKGYATRKYGFLIYFDVINRGHRSVQVDTWTLKVRSKSRSSEKLKPYSIPEPSMKLGEGSTKVWPVFGIPGPHTPGSTVVRPGEAVGGFAYYVLAYYGTPEHDLLVEKRGVQVTLEVTSILRQKARKTFLLEELDLKKVQEMIPNIEAIDDIWSMKVKADAANGC